MSNYYCINLSGHSTWLDYANEFATQIIRGGENTHGCKSQEAFVRKFFAGNGGTYGEDTFLYFREEILLDMQNECAHDGITITALPSDIAAKYFTEPRQLVS